MLYLNELSLFRSAFTHLLSNDDFEDASRFLIRKNFMTKQQIKRRHYVEKVFRLTTRFRVQVLSIQVQWRLQQQQQPQEQQHHRHHWTTFLCTLQPWLARLVNVTRLLRPPLTPLPPHHVFLACTNCSHRVWCHRRPPKSVVNINSNCHRINDQSYVLEQHLHHHIKDCMSDIIGF